MKINNVGYNHCHDGDFLIDRPEGSGDWLMILLKTDALFTIDGRDVKISENSLVIFRKGRPQRYRSAYQSGFANDWVHFEFEEGEEQEFLGLGLEYEKPVPVSDMNFFSFCIKRMASEMYSSNINREKSTGHYMGLIFSKASEYVQNTPAAVSDSYYEMLSTVRNRIYSQPYEQRTVGSSAHEVRMSVSNFQHLYKKYFGVTMVQDLVRSRVEYACMLFDTTGLTAVEISQRSGYNHYAHFVRQFRQITGQTPVEYRRNRKQ